MHVNVFSAIFAIDMNELAVGMRDDASILKLMKADKPLEESYKGPKRAYKQIIGIPHRNRLPNKHDRNLE